MQKVFGKYLGAAIVLLSVIVLVSIGTAGSAEAADAFPGVIEVYSNADLDQLFLENPSWTGSGTESDPYIIEDLDINSTGFEQAILIRNTDKHLVIRNCIVHDFNDYGIFIQNVRNVTLENNTCDPKSVQIPIGIYILDCVGLVIDGNDCNDNFYGISIGYSNNFTINDNNCSGSDYGIYLFQSEWNDITNNTCNDTLTGIILEDASNYNLIDNNTCNRTNSYGIKLDKSSINFISNNTCDSQGDDIYLVNSDSNTLYRNHCGNEMPGASGIYLTLSNNNDILENNCSFDNAGISLYQSSYNNISANICLENDGDGIAIDSSINNTVTTNVCRGNSIGGMVLYSSLSVTTGNEITSNTCSGNGFVLNSGAGIFLSSSTTYPISGNNISDNELINNYHGIWALNSGSNNITFNTVHGNQVSGIYLNSTSNCIVSSNTVYDNGDSGIWLDGSTGCMVNFNTAWSNFNGTYLYDSDDNVLSHNELQGNTYGIWLKTESDWNVIDNNNCSENSQAGIYLSFSDKCEVSNNTCGNNGQNSYHHGGIVIDISNDNLVMNNTCNGNPFAGVFIYQSLGNVLMNNTLNGNGNGIRADDSDNGIISGNEVHDNYHGIYLYNSDGNEIVENNCTSARLYHSYTVGIMLEYCLSNTLTDNQCNHNVVGMHIRESAMNGISDNNCDLNDNPGLMIGIKIDSSHQNRILNNSCSHNSIGINGIYSDENEMIGNNCSDNEQYGIYSYGISSDYLLICNNTCNNNAYGMWLEAMVDSTVCNNTCNDNRKAGMAIKYRSINNQIANNTISNNGYQLVSDIYGMWYAGVGLAIDGTGDQNECNGNIIADNTIDGSRLYGISIMHSADNRIFGNVLRGNNNTTSAFDPMWVQAYDDGSNHWNATDYGNLWADWTSPDVNGDGIVEEAYLIDGGANNDLLPLAVSVAITSPADGFVTGETSVDISGTAVSYLGVDHLTWHNAATGASGDCSGTDVWTATVPLADGDNVITVTMVDLHGSEANASITVVLDVVPPTLEITYPSEGEYVGSSVTVTWIGSDADSGIAYYIVSIEGLFSVNVTESSYTINDLTEGTYTVLVSAYDAAGNYLGVAVSFAVDVTAPAVTIESPDDNFISTTNSITVTWNGSDTGSGVDHYEVSWEGGSPVTLLPSDSTYTFNGLSDGSHVLTVTVYDKAGLSSSDAVTVRVDTQPPSLTITYPVEGGYVANSDVTVTWSGFDAGTGVAYYTASIEGLAPFNTTGTSCTFNDLADGTYTVLVSAYDQLGNHRDVTATFTVDTVAPALAIDSPEEGQLLNSSSVTVSWNTTDDNPGTVLVRFDDEAWATATGEEFSKTALNDGHHTAYVKATDAAGNSVEGMVNFTVDTTAPTVAFISPGEGSLVNSSTGMVEWAVDDAVSSIRVDGDAWIELGPNTSWEYSLEDGAHIIEVKVTDLAGNSAIATLNITVDTVAPEAEVSPIGDDLELDLVILVEFSEEMNQTSVSVVVPGVTGALDWEGNAVMFTPSVLYYNHEYAVQVTGKDLAGNGFEVNWTFSTRSVGNLTGVILDENGDPVSNVTVTAGGEFTTVTDENGRFVFLNLSVGTYLFEVDAEGYEPFSFNATVEQGVTSDQGTVEMVLDDTEGEEDDGGSIWQYVIIAIIVVAVLGVVAFVFLRKK